MFNSDFCFTCLGLGIVIYEADTGRKVDASFLHAALFLRVPHSPNIQYDLEHTITRFKDDLDPAAIEILKEQARPSPTTDCGRALADAVVLTLLTRGSEDLVRFVTRTTQQSNRGAVSNLVRVMKGQRMFTQIGRSILNELRPKISKQLEGTFDAARS